MPNHIDFLVVDGDFVLDAAGFAKTVSDRQSIGQDIKHRLIESGLVLLLLGQRADIERQSTIIKILIEVDKDERLEPGTASVVASDNQTFYITADTLEYGPVQINF